MFFGLFSDVIKSEGRIAWKKASNPRHVIWGWLQIDKMLQIESIDYSLYDWARNHPHLNRGSDKNNTIYVARENLMLPGLSTKNLKGASVFKHFRRELQLTDTQSTRPSVWKLPRWIYPGKRKTPLTYHPDLSRWSKEKNSTKLKL